MWKMPIYLFRFTVFKNKIYEFLLFLMNQKIFEKLFLNESEVNFVEFYWEVKGQIRTKFNEFIDFFLIKTKFLHWNFTVSYPISVENLFK
jgi:hypothetical protein